MRTIERSAGLSPGIPDRVSPAVLIWYRVAAPVPVKSTVTSCGAPKSTPKALASVAQRRLPSASRRTALVLYSAPGVSVKPVDVVTLVMPVRSQADAVGTGPLMIQNSTVTLSTPLSVTPVRPIFVVSNVNAALTHGANAATAGAAGATLST